MLARLQSRNLNGRSPRSDPNEPFMNRRFDLKNSFFSSTKMRSGTQNGIHCNVCPCADVVLRRCVGIKGIY